LLERISFTIMSQDFNFLPDRIHSECEKWQRYGSDVLPMWVADMDFLSPQPVIDALSKRVEHGVFGYPCEMPELIQAVVERVENLYHWTITPEDVVLLPGVVTGFNLACHALGKPGEGVLIQTPVYPPFLYASGNAKLLRQEAELTRAKDGTYSIDFEAFEAAITPQTRLFILCNPHNPVGRVFTRLELEKMAAICMRHNVWICSDEIHCDLLFSGFHHIPIATLNPEVAQKTITLIAPSKTYNIAGLECSFAIIQNPELRKTFTEARQGLVSSVNLFGQTAALAAYQKGQPWLDEMLAYLEGNRDALHQFVQEELPGIQMAKPEGTYLAWLDCRGANLPESPQKFFLDHARVAMNDGAAFGKIGEGFTRFNFGCPYSMMMEALERMKNALLEYQR
jgi:cysteine-S-conjugate beta-lyase